MLFPVLTSIFILLILIRYKMNKADKEGRREMDEFWARERAANEVRKKPLDNLDYLTIPEEYYTYAREAVAKNSRVQAALSKDPTVTDASPSPETTLTTVMATSVSPERGTPDTDQTKSEKSRMKALEASCAKAEEALRILNALLDEKIVKFTGMTNTDLKLEYGTANITVLTRYDNNYTMMVRALQMLGEALHEQGENEKAMEVLEFALKSKTDVGASYKLLADICLECSNKDKIPWIIEQAEALNYGNSAAVARSIREKLDLTQTS